MYKTVGDSLEFSPLRILDDGANAPPHRRGPSGGQIAHRAARRVLSAMRQWRVGSGPQSSTLMLKKGRRFYAVKMARFSTNAAGTLFLLLCCCF